MSKELIVKDEIPTVVEYLTLDKQKITLSFDSIKRLLVHGNPNLITLEEAVFFMEMCKARGLNPYKKDCYLIKYNEDPAAIIVSIDYYRARASAQSNCVGWQVGVIVQTKDGNVKYTNGLVLPNETLLGAWFEAKPKNWEVKKRHEVNLNGYLQYKKSGGLTKFWTKEKQPTQIMKVVEAQGLRSVWPSEFEKLYIQEEIYENPNDANGYIEPDKATISIDDFKPAEEQPEINSEPQKEESKADTPKVSLKELRDRIFKACIHLGDGDIEGAKTVYHQYADIINPKEEQDENGDKSITMERIVAKDLKEISIEQARVIWGKVKKDFKERGLDIKKIIGID